MNQNIVLEIYKRLYSFYGSQHWWPGDSPFEIAIGAILTQNTNWSNVEKAIKNLKEANLLSPEELHKIPEKKLAGLIRSAGYYNVKTLRVKAFIDFLMKNYSADMEKMKEESLPILRKKLLSIYGIGPETADSIILYALNKPVFVVDAYTKRVFSRHGIMDQKASYDDYQRLFHKELDEDVKIFNEYHALLVRVAKDFCKSKPKCEECPLKFDILFPNQQ